MSQLEFDARSRGAFSRTSRRQLAEAEVRQLKPTKIRSLSSGMTPVVFDGCFGWFHPGGRARGVVLCSPIGPEADYAHRAWRDLAERLAAAGVSVLRFDYLGARDSLDGDPGRPLSGWLSSIKAARRWLEAEAGCREVALLGLRFGAALATAAAEAMGGVERMALLAPVSSGKDYHRELSMLSRMSEWNKPVADQAGFDDGGVGLSAQVVADVRGLELCRTDVLPARRVLILPRPGGEGHRRLAARLLDLGAEVREGAFTGYSRLMVAPEVAASPDEAFDKVVDWLSEDLPPSAPARAPALSQAAIRLQPGGARETAVFLRDEAPLFGVLCAPPRVRRDRSAVLFLNTAAISHAGMSRMWVSIGRRLAAEGLTSLRFDISGIGDSPARPGQRDPVTHMEEALGDVAAAMDWLNAQGYSRITLVGFCWGAQLACNVALRDERVGDTVLINPRRLFWELHSPPNPQLGLSGYLRRARDPGRWRALAKGGIPLGKVAEAAVDTLRRTVETRAAVLSGRESPSQAAARKLRGLAGRGTQTLLIQGFDDPFLAEFEDYFSVPRQALGGMIGMKTYFPAGVDHLFRNDEVRADLAEAVAAHLAGASRSRPTLAEGAS